MLQNDRVRWRKQRQQARRREIEQDAQDARREAEEAAALQKESEEFLARQADMFSAMSGSATLNPDATSGEPPKLKLLAVQPTEKQAEEGKSKPKPKAAAAFAAADEDETSGTKKRELIPLNYSDDEDDEEKVEKKKRKVKELVSAIPTDKAGLWRYDVKWEQLNEVGELPRVIEDDADIRDAGRGSYETRSDLLWPRNPLSTSVQKKRKS